MSDRPVGGLPAILLRRLETLPDGPGVYLWKDRAGDLLYVGKARNLRNRVRSYLTADHGDSPKNSMLKRLIHDVETIVVETEGQALLLENNLIKEHQPRFNIRLKDDKSYPSIAVTAEPFPRVLVTRRRDLPGARYFGPFTDVSDMRRALATVRRLFFVRSCADDLPRERRDRPCLDWHIGRCRAPCVGRQSEAEYGAMIAEVVGFLAGDTGDVRMRLRKLMHDASERTDFERAKHLRDTLRWLEQVESPAAIEITGSGDTDVIGFARDGDDAVGLVFRVRGGKVTSLTHRFLENLEEVTDPEVLEAFLVRYYVPLEDRARRAVLSFVPEGLAALESLLPATRWLVPQRGRGARWRDLADQNARHLLEGLRLESFEVDERAEDPVYALGRELGLAAVPRSVACIDVSTNQGRDTVGSLVWFEAGRPQTSEYRRFRIKGLAQQDDYAAIAEVVTRYLSRRTEEGDALPDLLVIDGGKGQLAAATGAAIAIGITSLPIVSLAKRDEEVFFPDRPDPLRLPRRDPALRLLQRLRDEAHRFGLAYSRHRRTQRVITSELLGIPGIGPNRRRALLQRFGSLAGVRTATRPELLTVTGISEAMADRILNHLKEHG
jgi:excinuclease ABC subunit C